MRIVLARHDQILSTLKNGNFNPRVIQRLKYFILKDDFRYFWHISITSNFQEFSKIFRILLNFSKSSKIFPFF